MIRRSYLFAPGHREDLVAKAKRSGADAVVLDLEDAVPADQKDHARAVVARSLAESATVVRVNPVGTTECDRDLDAVAGRAEAIRVPKCERPEDVARVAAASPGTPLICAVETARGVLAAGEIAGVEGVENLSIGGIDMRTDLRAGPGNAPMAYVRAHLVVVSRAHDLDPPIDSVYPGLADPEGLRFEACYSRDLGFLGKSVIHPRQLEVVHEVFTPSDADVEHARAIFAAFRQSCGAATRTEDGEFVDAPVVARALQVLALVGADPNA